MSEEKEKDEVVGEAAEVPEVQKNKRRQIILETDGNNVFLTKAEVNGRIELMGVLNTLIVYLNNQK